MKIKQLTIFDDINHQRYLKYRKKMLPIILDKIDKNEMITTNESCLLYDYERAVYIPDDFGIS